MGKELDHEEVCGGRAEVLEEEAGVRSQFSRRGAFNGK